MLHSWILWVRNTDKTQQEQIVSTLQCLKPAAVSKLELEIVLQRLKHCCWQQAETLARATEPRAFIWYPHVARSSSQYEGWVPEVSVTKKEKARLKLYYDTQHHFCCDLLVRGVIDSPGSKRQKTQKDRSSVQRQSPSTDRIHLLDSLD